MKLQLENILNFIEEQGQNYTYIGDKGIAVEGFCALSNLKSYCITWIKRFENFDISAVNKELNILFVTNTPEETSVPVGYNVIMCNDPKAVFFSILNNYWKKTQSVGIAPTAVVETTHIGRNVSIGHNCYISPDVIIGDDVVIEHNVSIINKAVIGDRVLIHAGARLGTDGYGYYTDINGLNQKVEHYGGIVIGADSEVGANTCIDRGTLDDTVIGRNVKIDNLCHIAHNVKIEDNSMVIALSLLGGSSHLKRNSYIAPGVMVINQATIGEDAYVGMGAVVVRDVPDNKLVAGVPAKILRDNK